MVKEAGVELLMHCELADVKMKDGKIRSIIVSGKGQHIEITADVFIDEMCIRDSIQTHHICMTGINTYLYIRIVNDINQLQ